MNSSVTNISPNELKSLLEDSAVRLNLIDVRENQEVSHCSIPSHIHIRLSEIPTRYQELDPTVETVVYCKVGGRSMEAARFLSMHGFASVKNLEGGILKWSEDVDPTVPKY